MTLKQEAAIRSAVYALGTAETILSQGWPDECALMRLAKEELRKAFAEGK